MDVKIENSWKEKLKEEFDKDYFVNLVQFVRHEYQKGRCFPPASKIFNAFDSCPFDNVKVVILGQDPYHEPNQANGLAFSVSDGVKIPPSLVNIFTELRDDLGIATPVSGNLERWANQGVLLLNSTLTVREHAAFSHSNQGWEKFTDAVIEKLNNERQNLVFLLWGSPAIKKGAFIDKSRHLTLTSPHPSPLSAYRGFFGNKHFSKTNAFLKSKNISEIEWD